MAYSIINQRFVGRKGDNATFRIKAVLDAASDLNALGANYAPGSVAVVADGGTAYLLNASGEWKQSGNVVFDLAEGVSF